ncbi:MAG: hypothetical protein EX263_09245, partial [Flavobacteriaceae bacterium]
IILLLICLASQTIFAQKNVAVYWDASYSMKDRNLDRELKFLDNYFKKHTEANVILYVFSNEILLKEIYKVRGSQWTDLKTELQQTVYDGASSYAQLFKDDADEFLLFTDGVQNLDQLNPPTTKPIHIVASLDQTNTKQLKLVSDLSSGRFVYLSNDFGIQGEEKKEELVTNRDDGFIAGTISGFEGKLANVSIVNQSSNNGTASDPQGKYKIKADEGDVLIFSYLGKKTVSVRVSKADIINISMADIKENLDEVVLTAEAEKEEFVNTGNTTTSERSIGYAVESISADEISALDTDVQQAVKGQFSNLFLPNDTAIDDIDLSQFLGRGRNMTILLNQNGLVVVDGVPQEQSNSEFGGFRSRAVSTMNPDLIESITYLKGLAATNKYGTLGRNGVLLITTKNAKISEGVSDAEAIPLGTTATYSGNAEIMSKLPNVQYIQELTKSQTIEDAFDTYLSLRKDHGDSPIFYLDAYEYFKGWNNPILSERILSNIYEISFNDPKVLKAMAYKQQESSNFEDAVLTLERVLELQPKMSQSYRDLALAYHYAGQYQKALDLFNRMEKKSNVGNADFSGIYKTIFNETKNLIAQHGSELNTVGTDQKFMRPIKYKSRIVFEWNDLDAEFDLNIINPQNRFFTWSHTQSENSQRILQQHQQGYGLEEFYLTEADLGEWKFNMKYYGKTSNDKNPTFIKITTYNNFGSSNETRSIKVIRLDEKDIEQTVTKLVLN